MSFIPQRRRISNTNQKHALFGRDEVNEVVGVDGKHYTTNQATIWRWRQAYQHDFAARIDWSNTDSFIRANHRPVAAFAGNTIQDIIHIMAKPEETVRLSATSSTDPDGDRISYRWFQYREAGTLPAKLKIETTTKSRCPSRLAAFQDKAHSTSSWKRMMMASQVCVVIVGLLSQSSLEQREG